MKRRLFTLLLTFVMVVSMLPVAASAKTVEGYISKAPQSEGSTTIVYTFSDGTTVTVDKDGKVVSSTASGFQKDDTVTIGTSADHEHQYVLTFNRKGHFYGCVCGAAKKLHPHDDPLEAGTGYCSCGYQYYTNADLTFLWLTNVRLDSPYKKDTTEYTAKTVSWKNVKKTRIRFGTVDARATVELPEDLTIKKGENVFTITVTAEDRVTTKTYTVTVIKK